MLSFDQISFCLPKEKDRDFGGEVTSLEERLDKKIKESKVQTTNSGKFLSYLWEKVLHVVVLLAALNCSCLTW